LRFIVTIHISFISYSQLRCVWVLWSNSRHHQIYKG